MNTLDDKRQVRFLMDEAAHDRIRLAAALRRTTMAAFCRAAVLKEAAVATEGVTVPGQDAAPTRKPKRSK